MNKATLAEKLEEITNNLREELAKNEGSTLTTISTNLKLGYESVKATIMGNETAKKWLEEFKEQVDTFEEAVKKGDRTMSAKTLEFMEKTVQDLKNKPEQK